MSLCTFLSLFKTISYLVAYFSFCCIAVSLAMNLWWETLSSAPWKSTYVVFTEFSLFFIAVMFPKNFRRLVKRGLPCLNAYLLSLIKLHFTVWVLFGFFFHHVTKDHFLNLLPCVMIIFLVCIFVSCLKIFFFLNIFLMVRSQESSLWHVKSYSYVSLQKLNLLAILMSALALSYWLRHWNAFPREKSARCKLVENVCNCFWTNISEAAG